YYGRGGTRPDQLWLWLRRVVLQQAKLFAGCDELLVLRDRQAACSAGPVDKNLHSLASIPLPAASSEWQGNGGKGMKGTTPCRIWLRLCRAVTLFLRRSSVLWSWFFG